MWAERGKGEPMGEEHRELVDGMFRNFSPVAGTMLDIGCGVGMALQQAMDLTTIQPSGIDLSPEMINLGKQRLPQADLQVGSAAKLPWGDNTFDQAISVEAMYYFANPESDLAEICRVIKPGGTFTSVIEFFADNTGSANWSVHFPMKMHLLSTQEWKDIFAKAGFKNVETAIVKRKTYETKEEFHPNKYYKTFEEYWSYIDGGALVIQGEV